MNNLAIWSRWLLPAKSWFSLTQNKTSWLKQLYGFLLQARANTKVFKS